MIGTVNTRDVADHARLAQSTWASGRLGLLDQFTHATEGLLGEIAEVQAILAHARQYDLELDRRVADLQTELGDVYYYLLIATDLAGATLVDLAAMLFATLPEIPIYLTDGRTTWQTHQALAVYLDTATALIPGEYDRLGYLALAMGAEAGKALGMVTKARFKRNHAIDQAAYLAHLAQVYHYLLLFADQFELELADLGERVFGKLAGGHGWTDGRQGARRQGGGL